MPRRIVREGRGRGVGEITPLWGVRVGKGGNLPDSENETLSHNFAGGLPLLVLHLRQSRIVLHLFSHERLSYQPTRGKKVAFIAHGSLLVDSRRLHKSVQNKVCHVFRHCLH